MSVAQDKLASAEMVVNGVTLKGTVGKAAASADTVKEALNLAAVIMFSGNHADSTGTQKTLGIFVGETAPTGEYDNAEVGSLFIKTGATGALYMMTSAGTWQIATFQ